MLDTTRPASRILTLLELLQDRPGMSGPELATELEVTTRTVRRYIATLQDMGIPVEPITGRTGGYWLRPGYRLPPLMFSSEEAIGLAVALLASRTGVAGGTGSPVEQALNKIERVLPEELKTRMHAVRDAIQMPTIEGERLGVPNPTVLATLAQASLSHRRCWLRYSRPDGDETAREVDPYGVVLLSGRWYLHGWCYLRQDRRTFRIDRVRRVDMLPQTFAPPVDLDVTQAVMESIATARATWRIELRVAAPMESLRRADLTAYAVLTPEPDGKTHLMTTTDNLHWFARELCRTPWDVEILEPLELAEAMQQVAERLLAMANRCRSRAEA